MSDVVNKGINFGNTFSLREFLEDVNSKKLVFFGGESSSDKIVKMQTVVAMGMLARAT